MNYTLYLAFFSPLHSLVAFFVSEKRSWQQLQKRQTLVTKLSDVSCGCFEILQKNKNKKPIARPSLGYTASPYFPRIGVQFLSHCSVMFPLWLAKDKATLSWSSKVLYFFLALMHREPIFCN